MKDIKDIKCFLLDMDGTIYLGDQLIDGALDFLSLLEEQDKSFVFLTNNSSKNSTVYVEKLKRLGIEVDENKIFTSGEATTIYLKNNKPGAKVFLLGTPSLEEEFCRNAFTLVNGRDEDIDYVVLGFDTTLTYEKLWIACDYIRNGKTYLATHPDYNCPLEEGKFMPDAGAMIAFIKASTGKEPYVIGKPNKTIIDAVASKYGFKKEEIAMVGDRLYTDIKTGENAGITSVLVLSGETTNDDYDESDIRADFVYTSIKELKDAVK